MERAGQGHRGQRLRHQHLPAPRRHGQLRQQLGGGRNLDFGAEATTKPGLTERVQRYLEALLHEVVLPGQQPRIDYRWSGVMGFSPALAPIVEWVRPGVLAAVRCNGMGVAMGAGTGWLAAKRLAG